MPDRDSRSTPTSFATAVRGGAYAGALGALFCALGDFGATWLWLPVWRDRAMLLVELIATLTPLGFFAGALGAIGVFAASELAQKIAPARANLVFPLPIALASIYPMRLLALKLCSGGMMSRLPQRDAVTLVLSVFLPAFVYVVAGAVAYGTARVRGTRKARAGSLVLIALAFALGKLNQTVYPNLYDYLHAGLAVITWLSASLAASLLLGASSAHNAWRSRNVVCMGAAAALLGIAVLNARTLDDHLNVRVAMFDPRSPVSRSVLSSAEPLLTRLSPAPERTAAQRLTRVTADTRGFPTQPGAHVVLVTIDALRADHLGAYGYTRPTSPALDAYARESMLFRRAYAQAPHSSYSLSSLHTSEYIHEVVELTRPLPTATLASVFRENGYHTAAFFTDGIFHTEGHRLTQYRDSALDFALFDHTNREAEDQTDRVLAEADRIVKRGEGPSFFWVHYFDVHEPYQDTHFGGSDMDRYDSEILHTDRELARLLRGLDDRFERDVVVAISADHGEEFREHGGVYHGSTLFDEQVRVPLVLHAKSLPAAVIEAPVEVIDIAPTLLSAVGIPPAKSMRGKDLRAFSGDTPASSLAAFSAVLTKRMAVRLPYKLIADLRFGLFELYDVDHDPLERRNLAGSSATALADMRGLIYGWLDSLEHVPGGEAADEPRYERALRWGRLGDRRAVIPMAELLRDTAARTEDRVEAGQFLAKLADESSADSLVAALTTHPPEVAAEAAIALGRMYDDRAREYLVPLVSAEDPYLRARAAVSLGRLRDVRAVGALIDALWVAPTQYEREEAVRWLGRLRDARATEPLLSVLPEFGLRYLVSVALGQVGDDRAYAALSDMLTWEHHTNVRDELVRGLGLLGDVRALPALLPLLQNEPELRNTAESMVRLGALEKGVIGGLDIAPGSRGMSGLGDCQAGPMWHDWDFAGRTTCTSLRAHVALALPVGPAHGANTATLLLRIRRSDAPDPAPLTLRRPKHADQILTVDANSNNYRIALDVQDLAQPTLHIELDGAPSSTRITLDHALIVPGA